MDVQKFLDLQYEMRGASLAADKVLTGEMEFDEWRERARVCLRGCLGKTQDKLPSLQIEEMEKPPQMDVEIQRISYLSEEGLETPAYVLRPKGVKGNLPAVVAVTGHGYGHRDATGLNFNGHVLKDVNSVYTRGFALNLCRRGFMVIAPELLGFGDLRLSEDAAISPDKTSCDRIDGVLKLLGRSLGGVRVLQALRAIDALAEIGGADMERVGMMGISGGGLVTAFATALSDRVRACVVSGYANTFQKSVMAMHHCVDNFFFGLADALELPDILSSIAPRPMLWEAGNEDPIFPIEGVLEAHEKVMRMYRAMGAPEAFKFDAFSGEHRISGAMAYDFLWTELKG